MFFGISYHLSILYVRFVGPYGIFAFVSGLSERQPHGDHRTPTVPLFSVQCVGTASANPEFDPQAKKTAAELKTSQQTHMCRHNKDKLTARSSAADNGRGYFRIQGCTAHAPLGHSRSVPGCHTKHTIAYQPTTTSQTKQGGAVRF